MADRSWCSRWGCTDEVVVARGEGWDEERTRNGPMCARHAKNHTYRCPTCDATFYRPTAIWRNWHDEPPRGYCSPECRAEAERRRKARTPVVHVEQACDHCGDPFMPARSDARFCSGRCRVAAHRAAWRLLKE